MTSPSPTSSTPDDLLSGYLDGELTPQQRQLVEVRAQQDPAVRAQLDELRALQARVGNANLTNITDQEIRHMLSDSTSRITEGLGWLLLLGSTFIGVGYGIWQFAFDDSTSTSMKVVVGAAYVGLGLLLLSVVRQRLIERKSDRYRDVDI